MNTPTNAASRVWLITGASAGLGRAIAEAALERGDRVVATARNPDRLRDLTSRYPEHVSAVSLDVTNAEQATAAVEAAMDAFGRIDVVVNSAGYGLFGALEELPADEIRRQFETNVFGSMNVTRAALPELRAQQSGHIVQVSSLEGVVPALAGESAYAASKFAVEGLCEGLAKDIAHLGLRVTIVEPGPVRTDFATGATIHPPQHGDYAESVGKALAWFAELPGNQPNDPDRIAAAVLSVVDVDNPPLRLPLGAEAHAAIGEKLDSQRRDLDTWHELSQSAAIPA